MSVAVCGKHEMTTHNLTRLSFSVIRFWVTFLFLCSMFFFFFYSLSHRLTHTHTHERRNTHAAISNAHCVNAMIWFVQSALSRPLKLHRARQMTKSKERWRKKAISALMVENCYYKKNHVKWKKKNVYRANQTTWYKTLQLWSEHQHQKRSSNVIWFEKFRSAHTLSGTQLTHDFECTRFNFIQVYLSAARILTFSIFHFHGLDSLIYISLGLYSHSLGLTCTYEIYFMNFYDS